MNAREIFLLRTRMGLHQWQFGKLVFGGPDHAERPDRRQRAVQRWETGVRPQQLAMEKLELIAVTEKRFRRKKAP